MAWATMSLNGSSPSFLLTSLYSLARTGSAAKRGFRDSGISSGLYFGAGSSSSETSTAADNEAGTSSKLNSG